VNVVRLRVEVYGVDVLDYDSFSALMLQIGIRPRTYSRNIDQLEVMDTLSVIEELGDEILRLSHNDLLPEAIARSFLFKLIACNQDPLNSVADILAIHRELRGHKL